jgi:hypothetical protein
MLISLVKYVNAAQIAGEEAAAGTEKDRLDTDAGLKEMKFKDDVEVLPMTITQTESTVCEEKNVHEEDAEVPATAELVDDGHIHGCSFMSLMNGDEHVMDTVQDDTNGMSQLESEISVLSEAPEVRVQQLDGITTGLLQSGTLLDTEGTSDTHFLEEMKPDLEGLSSRIQKLGGKCEHARTKWCSKCMVLKKGHHMCRLEVMGNEDGDDSSLMERQDSAMEVGTPPPPLQSPGFKVCLFHTSGVSFFLVMGYLLIGSHCCCCRFPCMLFFHLINDCQNHFTNVLKSFSCWS